MRTLALDGGMGASGDMLLAALLAAGADRSALVPVEDALGVRYAVSGTDRNGISATSVDVLIEDDHDRHAHNGHDQADRDHYHDHDDLDHSHDEGEHPAEGHGPHRHYADVVDIVEGLDVPEEPRADALAIFEILGEAEAAVHGTDLEETHFHEVGADDAIADVVGVALLLADLDVDQVLTTPLSAGDGEVEMAHGTYPIPPPAVVEIAERADWELQGGPVDAELLTPTGAAILAHVAEGVERLPPMDVDGSGYGAGSRFFEHRPNVLRAMVGTTEGPLTREPITVLETNLDDATPEVLGDLQRSLADVGARDVSVVPVTMKKSRPGHLVRVVCDPTDAERIAARLAEETGTLGVREHGAGHRWVADREVVTTTILEDGERHEVGVKLGLDEEGTVFDVSTEYDDAAEVADALGLSLREVCRRAEAAVREGHAERLVHVLDAADWESHADEESYAPPSLEQDGFVHLSTPSQVLAVAEAYHADDEDPKLLVIDPERVDAEVRYEEQPSGGYAHVYGPLNRDAIEDVVAFPRQDGRFVLPDPFRP